MYRIEQTDYGIRLLFDGKVSAEETAAWLSEFTELLDSMPGPLSVFVDMRRMELLSPDAQQSLEEGQKLARQTGMTRSVVLLANPTLTYQFKRIALQSGIYDWERYIDASTVEAWEEIGLNWVREGIDPDAERRKEIASRRDRIKSSQ